MGGPAATYDEAATQRKLAGIDETLAAGNPSMAAAPLPTAISPMARHAGVRAAAAPRVPKPDVSGITGDDVTYNIEVRFRLDSTGLVTGVNIVKSGNSALNNAVLSAARGMRFDCTAEARGRRTYEVRPGGR